MAWCLSRCLLLISCLTFSHAQSISTTMTVPPLQWINLTGLLQGPPAPPLMDVAIGYDDTTRNLLIFGGESAAGFPQSQTYLLNLESLTWSTPTPPSYLTNTPPARSAALSGDDSAASNRHGHVVIGGMGTGNKPLSDAWEFQYTDEFWAPITISPGGPSPRWGASGGIDIRTAPVQDPVVPGPNNTIYLAGGFDGTSPDPLSDVWEFRISGTLSSNLPNSVNGSWHASPVGTLPAKIDQGGTVLQQSIVAVGGCTNVSTSDDSCAQSDSYVINMQRNSYIAPAACPAPRLGPALAPNFNGFSTSFSSQVFMLLGTYNTSLWQDNGGLEMGEVAVLDTNTGSWSRIIPSGDPGTSGSTPTFPGPREGAVALSFTSALVGNSRSAAADTIVFGGRDASGNYLNDVWILRAYNGSVSGPNQTWTGFGNGQLQTGVNANGAGVTVQYMTSCATAIGVLPPGISSPTGSSMPSSPTYPTSGVVQSFDTSLTHKLLAPLSVALLLPAVILARLASPSVQASNPSDRQTALLYTAALIAIISYGVGIGGLASSFTSITSSTSLTKRSSSNITLTTGHGKAGLALFIGLYGLVPVLYVIFTYSKRSRRVAIVDEKPEQSDEPSPRANSNDTGEKHAASTPPSTGHPSPPASPRPRLHSWGPTSWTGRRSRDESADDDSVASAGAQRAFEVVNRPTRHRHSSANGFTMPGLESSHVQRLPVTPRNLGDVNWLDRRRTLNAVGELDYALNQPNRTQRPSTPATADMLSTQALMTTPNVPLQQPDMPQTFEIVIRLLFHGLLLGLCVLSLAALWFHPPRAGFAVFLVWTVAFYVGLILFAWHGRPQYSILATLLARFHTGHQPIPSASPPSPRPLSSIGLDQYPFPTDSRGPYIHHQPPYRAAMSAGHDDASTSHGGPRSVETDDDDDDDEDTRQRRIEEEMGRRDVSIVTVPKRKLWITNPS